MDGLRPGEGFGAELTDRDSANAGTLRSGDGVAMTNAKSTGAARTEGVSRLRLVASRGPYYWRLLKSLPYGAARRFTHGKCRSYPLMDALLKDKYGLEIGGPSPIFCRNRLIPVYGQCRKMDNSNFSSQTIWNLPLRKREPGFSFARQYVAEASDLSQVRDETYDFVLASHVLEHVANPLRALQEWRRVLSPKGTMLVIVPDRRGTFDYHRTPTSFEHIEADFLNNTSEDDLTHVDEILAWHDIALDPCAGSRLQFRERCRNNAAVRAMHHHVFVPEVLVRMLSRMQMAVLSVAIERPSHIVVFAQRVDAVERDEAEERNLELLSEAADWRRHDPLGKVFHAVADRLKAKFARTGR
jgi:SAM-dependent methyltransferase